MASYEQDALVHGGRRRRRHAPHRARQRLRPQVYVHHLQDPDEQMAVVLRTSDDPMALATAARAVVSGIDPISRWRGCARWRRWCGRRSRAGASRMFLLGVFAVLAVTLAVVGLYAVVSFSVAERIQEMGVRLALGARPSN